MFWQSTKWRVAIIAVTALNALLFAARHDWNSVGYAVATGGIFLFFIIRDRKKPRA
jgi:hypothetical protein